MRCCSRQWAVAWFNPGAFECPDDLGSIFDSVCALFHMHLQEGLHPVIAHHEFCEWIETHGGVNLFQDGGRAGDEVFVEDESRI